MAKSIKLGMVMDPIAAIKAYKDSSFAMLLEAQSRACSKKKTILDEFIHKLNKDGGINLDRLKESLPVAPAEVESLNEEEALQLTSDWMEGVRKS